MSKKNLQSVADRLGALAATQPTQHVAPAAPALSVVKPKPKTVDEPMAQFSFYLRRSQKRQLDQLAMAADMTARAFVLDALKGKGLDVTEADLTDRRKRTD